MTWRLILGMTLAAYIQPLQADTLTLQHALAKIDEQSRPLKAAEAEMQMRLADAWQAGLLPNPLLSIEVDDFGGSGFYRGFKHAEYSLSLTQPIDLSGKRTARQNVALAAVSKSYWNYEALKQTISRDLKAAFVNLVALQEHLNITEGLHQIAEEILASTNDKVASGKIQGFQKHRALMAYHVSKLVHNKARVDVSAARGMIAALLSDPCINFDEVFYPLLTVEPLQPLSYYEGNLENNPELASLRMDVYIASQAHRLERANRIPDLDVTASVNAANEEGGSFFIGFSIPIPVFDQNQGNICRSSWQTWQANYAQQDLEITLRTKLSALYQGLQHSYQAVLSQQGDLQNCAKEILEAAQEGHKQGKIELLELLDAHRTCGEIHNNYIESLKEYHLRLIEIENIAPTSGA